MARPTPRPSRTTRRLSRRVRWRNLLLAALAGGALAGSVIARPLPGLAFAFPLWMLSLLDAETPTWRRALALGWAAGTGCNLVAFTIGALTAAIARRFAPRRAQAHRQLAHHTAYRVGARFR